MAADYAGDVSADEALEVLASDKAAVLVDVRSRPEWQFVGIPDLSAMNKEPLLIEWQSYPAMGVNAGFGEALKAELARKNVSFETPVLFLCRSGARSRSAAMAMTAEGFTRCYNIAGGFEGPPDDGGHRGNVDGWKALKLPWTQT